MDQDRRRLYRALAARDRRFDGVFFVGVTSTGIYCRPICTVRTPKEANCRFFNTPQEAEQGRFRVDLRVAPSTPLVFVNVRLVQSGDRGVVTEER